ncbi:MAG: ATP-binding protein [bacterium]
MNFKNRWIQATIIGLFTLAIGILIFLAQVNIKEFENTGSTSLESTTNDISVSSPTEKEMESPDNDEISSFFPALGLLILIFIYSGMILFKNQKDRKVMEEVREIPEHVLYEMRMLMNGIMNCSQMLLADDLTKNQYDYVMNIRNSSHTVLTLLNTILGLPKIKAGRLDREIMDFDLDKTIEDIRKTEAVKALDKGINLVTFIESNVPGALRGDSGRLCQVIRNLVHNAITLTAQGEVMLSAELDHETDTHAAIRITITYQGKGIYEKGEGIPTETDLGVTVAAELIKGMGNEIHMESEKGKGFIIWFTVIFEKQIKFTGESPLDMSELLSRVHGNQKMIADLLDAFVIAYPQQLEDLLAQINAGNCERVDRCAHKLKETVATLSANKASELACKLEKMGKEKNLETAHEVYMSLEDELQKINVWKNSL